MPPAVTSVPAAVARLASKAALPAALRTEEWAQVPLAIRERAFFSAGVEQLRTLETMRGKLLQALTPEAGGVFMDRSKFVSEMRRQLGAVADGTKGALTDITGIRRLQLIYDHQVEDAHAYARWKADCDPELLDEYPCQELLRIESREKERLDWPARWAAAGGREFEGRMIARKDDPVWTKISRFGRPWPPFDFGSGMGVEDVHRSEAESLGVIAKGEQIESPEAGFNTSLKSSVAGLSETARELLADAFDGRVGFAGDMATLEDEA